MATGNKPSRPRPSIALALCALQLLASIVLCIVFLGSNARSGFEDDTPVSLFFGHLSTPIFLTHISKETVHTYRVIRATSAPMTTDDVFGFLMTAAITFVFLIAYFCAVVASSVMVIGCFKSHRLRNFPLLLLLYVCGVGANILLSVLIDISTL